jgi:N-glycosylase/DNA lyase
VAATQVIETEKLEDAVRYLRRQRKEIKALKALVQDRPELQTLVVGILIDGYLAAAAIGTDLVFEEMKQKVEEVRDGR